MANPSAIISLLAFSVNLSLGVYVLRKNPGAAANRSFALLMGSFVLWDLSEAILRYFSNGLDQNLLMLWLRIEWTGISAIGGVLLHFVLSYPTKKAILEWKASYALIYAPTLLIILLLWFSDLVVSGIAMGPLGYDASVGAGYPILALIYTMQIFASLLILLKTYQKSEVEIIKKRSKILLIGVAVPVIIGSATETFLPIIINIPTRLGIGSIYTVIMGIFSAYAIMKYKLLVIEPATEEFQPRKMEFTVSTGHNNLIESTDSWYAYNAFRNIVTDTPGLCITTTFPEKIRKKYGLERTPIVWISKTSLGGTTFKPGDLNFEICQTAMKFMRDNPKTSVLLEDLEYLTEVVGFEGVLRFVKILTDVASENNSTVIVPINPDAFGEREHFVLRTNFDTIQDASKYMEPPHDAFLSTAPNTILYLDNYDQCYERFRLGLDGKSGLAISTIHPRKLTSRFHPRKVRAIWLSEFGESQHAVDPSRLKYEVFREVARFLEEKAGNIILFEGLEYLIPSVGFSEVLEFLQSLIDLVSSSETELLVTLHPRALERRQVAVIRKRFDLVVS